MQTSGFFTFKKSVILTYNTIEAQRDELDYIVVGKRQSWDSNSWVQPSPRSFPVLHEDRASCTGPRGTLRGAEGHKVWGHSQVQPEVWPGRPAAGFGGKRGFPGLLGEGDLQRSVGSGSPPSPLFFLPGLAGDSDFETGSSQGPRIRNSPLGVVYRKRKTQVGLEMAQTDDSVRSLVSARPLCLAAWRAPQPSAA